MKLIYQQTGRVLNVLLMGLALALPWGQANAVHDIRGLTGTTFNLYAFPFNINLPEGSSLQMWGFGDQDAGAGATHAGGVGYELPQYPGPTLVVNAGDSVTINLTNSGVPHPVSIVVTGHNVTAARTDGNPSHGLVTEAANVGESVSYTFDAPEPLSLIHISEPTRPTRASRMPSSA